MAEFTYWQMLWATHLWHITSTFAGHHCREGSNLTWACTVVAYCCLMKSKHSAAMRLHNTIISRSVTTRNCYKNLAGRITSINAAGSRSIVCGVLNDTCCAHIYCLRWSPNCLARLLRCGRWRCRTHRNSRHCFSPNSPCKEHRGRRSCHFYSTPAPK